jgi:non-homologous end joining protein Ku
LRGSKTGEIVDRDRIVKGYEFERERYVTSIDDELNDLRIGSSKIIYRELAAETLRVIEYAMARSSKVGRGRVTISSRERPVLVEARCAGLLMSPCALPTKSGLPSSALRQSRP